MPKKPPKPTTAKTILLETLSRTTSSILPMLSPALFLTLVPITFVALIAVVCPDSVGMIVLLFKMLGTILRTKGWRCQKLSRGSLGRLLRMGRETVFEIAKSHAGAPALLFRPRGGFLHLRTRKTTFQSRRHRRR